MVKVDAEKAKIWLANSAQITYTVCTIFIMNGLVTDKISTQITDEDEVNEEGIIVLASQLFQGQYGREVILTQLFDEAAALGYLPSATTIQQKVAFLAPILLG